jgi:hypothetical protein
MNQPGNLSTRKRHGMVGKQENKVSDLWGAWGGSPLEEIEISEAWDTAVWEFPHGAATIHNICRCFLNL